MLPDPIAIDANSPNPALNFSVIRSDGYGAERRDVGGLYGAVINHTTSKAGDRHYVKITKTVDATNPYNGLVSPQSASISISFAKPAFGFTDTDMVNLYTLLTDLFAADGVGVENVIAFQS
jgi:hypothetical protein